MTFKLHQQLQKDCFFIKDLKLSQFLLMNNSNYPWFILVPKIENAVELIDLSFPNQQILLQEINQISKLSKNIFKYDKLNIATLGNVVDQLHVHIISRYKNDRVFPRPVWGGGTTPYEGREKKIIKKVKDLLVL